MYNAYINMFMKVLFLSNIANITPFSSLERERERRVYLSTMQNLLLKLLSFYTLCLSLSLQPRMKILKLAEKLS